MLKIREYVKVKDLEEAYQLNQKRSACVLGGMVWLKMGKPECGNRHRPVRAGTGYLLKKMRKVFALGLW